MWIAWTVALAAAWAGPIEDLVATHATTAADEYRIGRAYVDVHGWRWGRLDDPAASARVERILRGVVAASDRPDLSLQVTLSPNPEVNAFALPGGFVVVNLGALETFDDDELAFVLAHELSHVLLRHHAAGNNLGSSMEAVHTAEMAKSAGDKKALQRAESELVGTLLAFERQQEFEADLYGLLYAVRAGHPHASAVTAMEKLGAISGEIPSEVADKVSHPRYDQRVGDLKAGWDGVLKTHKQFDAGVALLEAGRHEAASSCFREFVALFPRSGAAWTNLAAAELGLAMRADTDPWHEDLPIRSQVDVSVRSGGAVHYGRAADALARALTQDPNHPDALVAMGILARRTDRVDEAVTLLERALELRPKDARVLNNLGVAEASRGRWKVAERRWASARSADPDALHIVANEALALEAQERTQDAIARWRSLEQSPALRSLALEHLRELGQSPSAPPFPEDGQGTPVALGGLGPGTPLADAVAALGPPAFAWNDEETLEQALVWEDQSVVLVLAFDEVVSVRCAGRCTLATDDGVGLGAPRPELEAIYGPPDDERALPGGRSGVWWTPRGLAAVLDPDEVTRQLIVLPPE